MTSYTSQDLTNYIERTSSIVSTASYSDDYSRVLSEDDDERDGELVYCLCHFPLSEIEVSSLISKDKINSSAPISPNSTIKEIYESDSVSIELVYRAIERTHSLQKSRRLTYESRDRNRPKNEKEMVDNLQAQAASAKLYRELSNEYLKCEVFPSSVRTNPEKSQNKLSARDDYVFVPVLFTDRERIAAQF